jgi:site-specific recombinase XerD
MHSTLSNSARSPPPPTRRSLRSAVLVTAGALTGARLGELVNADVGDFDAATGTLSLSGKTGQRNVLLQTEARKFFASVADGRPSNAPLLTDSSNGRWLRGSQQRRMKLALAAAGLPTAASYYALRHSFVSSAIGSGMPAALVASNLGTSETMLRQTYTKIFAELQRPHLERHAPDLRLAYAGE